MTIIDKEVIGEGELPTNEFPNVPLGIYIENVFQKNLELHGDATWLTDVSTGKSMKYSEMMKAVRSVASGLRKKGFQIGDNIVIIASNFIELPLMSFGVQRAGGFQACLNPANLPADVIEMRMRELNTKFILTDLEHSSWVVEFVKKCDCIQEVFLIGDEPVPGCTPFRQLLQDSGDECPEKLDEVDLNSPCRMSFTSGTTGLPKGIIQTHRVVIKSLLRHRTNNMKACKYLPCYTMSSLSGIGSITGYSLAHAELYCLSNFSEINLLSAIDQVKPAAIGVQPHHVPWICRYPQLDKYDLSSVMKIILLGSPINVHFEREIFDKVPNLLFLENFYGMTETGRISQNPSAPPEQWKQLDRSQTIAQRVFGSVGKVFPGVKLKVIDVNSGEKLGPNQVGEIYIKSPFMFKEYLNNPQETANLFRNGWIQTGDQGYYDENENIFVVGRLKELIKYRNVHVQPLNIERHLVSHPDIKDAAVVGLPNDFDGQRPLAFVVLSPESQNKVTADELITYVNERVTEMEKLRGGIRFIDSIPRNPSGKILRQELLKLL